MSNWTRAHDAWIARECEGLEVLEQDGLYLIFAGWGGKYQQEPEKLLKNVYAYDLDPSAAIRAAEAWRKKKNGRWWNMQSAIDGLNPSLPTADCWEHRKHWTGEVLAQALYLATGGVE